MKRTMKHNNLKRCALLVLTALFSILQMYALHASDTWKYKTTLNVSPSGKGTVYMDYNDNNTDNSSNTTTTSKSYPATVNSSNNTTSVTLNATPIDGWRFLRWEDGAGNVISSTSSSPTTLLTYDKTNVNPSRQTALWGIIYWYEYPEKNFSFTAFFKENGSVIAKVKDGQEAYGSAVISEEHFDVGDEIHLVASNINGSEMIGWSFDHWEVNGVNVSEKPEITVTVPDEVVTYVAVFTRADSENYYFIRNKATGRYLKLVGTADYTSNHQEGDDLQGSFNGSFEMRDEVAAVSDPGCVFIISGRELYTC